MMNRWHVYEYLKKQRGMITTAQLRSIHKGISERELKEGIIEYKLVAFHQEFHQEVCVVLP